MVINAHTTCRVPVNIAAKASTNVSVHITCRLSMLTPIIALCDTVPIIGLICTMCIKTTLPGTHLHPPDVRHVEGELEIYT